VSDEIARLRDEIDDTDRAIVAAVNTRLRLVTELWSRKRELGLDRLDPDRERGLRAQLAAANEGPLSAAGLERLVDELLALTKTELAEP
jgi:chorismate mutase